MKQGKTRGRDVGEEAMKMPSQGQLFPERSIPYNLVSGKITYAKQIWMSSLSLLLKIIKWTQSPCPGQMQIPATSKREGYVTTTVYGAPRRVITFTFSPPIVQRVLQKYPGLCLILGACEWGTADSFGSEWSWCHLIALAGEFWKYSAH